MFLISSLPLFFMSQKRLWRNLTPQMAETPHRPRHFDGRSKVEKSHSPVVCRRQAACHHGAVIKRGYEEMMIISSQPFFKREYQMRIMLPAAKRRQ